MHSFCCDFFDDFDDYDDLDELIDKIGRFPGDFTQLSPIKIFKIIILYFFIFMFLQISQELYLLYDCYHNDDCFMKQKNLNNL